MTLGVIGIAVSNRVCTQSREDWVLAGQRAGASVESFTLNLSSGEYKLVVWLWVHDYAEGHYVVSDMNKNRVAILRLVNTDQSSEWKYIENSFQIVSSGYYTFGLFNATFSKVRSTMRLFQRIHSDVHFRPYRDFYWVGSFSLVLGVPLVVVGLASLLTPLSKNCKIPKNSCALQGSSLRVEYQRR
jgi:hypothetical protein